MLKTMMKKRLTTTAVVAIGLITLVVVAAIAFLLVCVWPQPKEWPEKEEDDNNPRRIPRIIWTYWNDPEKQPQIVAHCIELIKILNPGYDVRVLSDADVQAYGIDTLRHARGNPTRTSDFLRFEVLSRHGGIWLDSSTLLTRSLEWVHAYNKPFVAYYADFFTTLPGTPIIESWFLACAKDCPFIRKVRDEFLRINEYEDVAQYVEHVTRSGVDIQNLSTPTYLTCHVSMQVVLQTQMMPRDIARDMQLISAVRDGSREGPFWYLIEHDWNPAVALASLCDKLAVVTDGSDLTRPHFYKMRGPDRFVLEQDPQLQSCIIERSRLLSLVKSSF
jgi:hypothetical protein